MNRPFLLFGLSFCLLLFLSSCGGNKQAGPPPASAPPASAPLPPAQQIAKPVAVAKPKGKPTQAASKTTKQEEREPFTTNDFAIKPSATNFGVVTFADTSLRDQFLAVIPKEDQASSRFIVGQPDEEVRKTSNQILPKVTLELPENFSPVLASGVNELGQPHRILQSGTGYELVLIPAGVFPLGSDTGPEDCQPAHNVYLSSYYMGVTEVTLGQFEQFAIEAKGAKVPQPSDPKNKGDAPEVPVVGIPWRDALNFANFHGMDLPTEAQWEKAGRGEQGFIYPWGNGRPLWEKPRRLGQITPVKTYQNDMSPYGIFDLAGNAREWTRDWYSSTTYEKTTELDGSSLRNPTGPSRADITSHRVIKGGVDSWELWRRNSAAMKDSIKDVGFRCVLNLTEE